MPLVAREMARGLLFIGRNVTTHAYGLPIESRKHSASPNMCLLEALFAVPLFRRIPVGERKRRGGRRLECEKDHAVLLSTDARLGVGCPFRGLETPRQAVGLHPEALARSTVPPA